MNDKLPTFAQYRVKCQAKMNSENPQKIHLELPLEHDMELLAAGTVDAAAKLMDFNSEARGEINLAVIEACINAIEHAGETGDTLSLTVEMEQGSLKITLADRGKGFDPSVVEIPDIREKLEGSSRKRGWGLTLIRQLMDDFSITSSPGGTTLMMLKRKQ